MAKNPVFFGFESRLIAPSSVPAGQIYLQNAGYGMSCLNPYHIGMARTMTARNTYFR